MYLKIIPKIISLILLWGVVASIIMFIDPELLEDVWIDNLYAPFLLAVFAATWYTMTIITGSGSIGVINALLFVFGLVLLLLKVFNFFTGFALVSAILLLSHFAIKRNSKDTLLRSPKVDNLGLNGKFTK